MADKALKPILPADLVAMDEYAARHPLRVDLVYAKALHRDNMFKCAIYRPDAKMWAHRELAPLILRAAEICHTKTKWFFELKDCLRPVEAQAAMTETDVVKANPHWLQEPRLLSPPGAGGHPRGMAVDIILVTEKGEEVDMGTPFDYLTTDPANNPAARDYKDLPAEVKRHRQVLQDSLMQAAEEADRELLPLPQEWWDFRFPAPYSNSFEPVSDKLLPENMRMMPG